MELLKSLYPEINWSRVDFYEGLPWFTPFLAPYVTAQAMPDFYSFSRYRIYLKQYDESSVSCIADIVHEGFHIHQAMCLQKGYGLGFLRGFIVRYNAFYPSTGYRQNPFEVPAYEQEYRVLEKGKGWPASLRTLKDDRELIQRSCSLPFPPIAALAMSFFFCLFVALLRPVADILVFIYLLLRFPGELRNSMSLR